MVGWKPKVDQPENPLFTNGVNANMNACVGDNGGPYNLFDYARGFLNSGHAIVKSAQEYVVPVDLAVYPAAFSYRHAVELYLKHLIFALNTILGTGETFKKNHSILKLWRAMVDLNAATRANLIEQEAVERAGELIGYFDAIDPTGEVFRYPEDIKENRHLADYKLINVEVLRDQMTELQEILERWVYEAAGYRDYQLEQIAEHGAK